MSATLDSELSKDQGRNGCISIINMAGENTDRYRWKTGSLSGGSDGGRKNSGYDILENLEVIGNTRLGFSQPADSVLFRDGQPSRGKHGCVGLRLTLQTGKISSTSHVAATPSSKECNATPSSQECNDLKQQKLVFCGFEGRNSLLMGSRRGL